MKKIEISTAESINGGDRWANYLASCGIAVSVLEASFFGGPILFGAVASYVATCALLAPIYAASRH